MKRYNKTLKNKLNKRDRIVYGENYTEEKYHAGLRRFCNLTADKLEKIIEQKLACDFINFGNSPSLSTYRLFSRRYKCEPAFSIVFCGYTCDNKRLEISDMEMVTIDTIKVTFDSHNLRCVDPIEIIDDFNNEFGHNANKYANIRKTNMYTLYVKFD